MKRQDVPRFGSLQNVKVIDCASAIAGPVCGTIMAEQGADVILVENKKMPDMYRRYKYGWPLERRNVRTICADVFSEGGKQVLKKLLGDADILIESSKGGTWAKMGLSDEVLWAINPKLVIVHISGFGLTGLPEYIAKPSMDSTGQCFSGAALINGDPDSTPSAINGPQLSDYYTCLTSCIGALSAYIRAQETGIGDSLDVAQYEATLRYQSDFAAQGFNAGVRAQDMRYPTNAPKAMIFDSKDGMKYYVFPGPGRVWQVLKAMGMPEDAPIPHDWIMPDLNHPGYTDVMYPFVKEYCLNHTGEEIEELANEGALVSPLLDYSDMLVNPQFIARGSIIEYHDDTVGGTVKEPAPVPRFANNPQQIWRGGPTMGMDNDDVLEEAGFSAEEIQGFYEAGVLLRK